MKLQRSRVPRLSASLPLAICLLAGCLALCGCVHVLRPYNRLSEQKVRVQSPNPQQYSVKVADEAAVPIPADGRITIQVPRLERGCAVRIFGVQIKDYSAYDLPAIRLNRGKRTVRRLSLNDLSKLPVDEQGYRLLKAD